MTLSQLSRWRGISGADPHLIGLFAVLVIAAAFRFYDLDRTSLWFDEVYSWWIASHHSLVGTITTLDPTPPLHLIILHFTIAIFGDSEIALRAPSALLGVLTVYLVYRLGNVLWDKATGLTAALFIALSGFHIWYSSEARTYALLAFVATLFILTLVNAIRRPGWVTLAGCAAAGTALLYSHVYGVFLFVGVNLAVLGAIMSRAAWVKVSFWPWVISQAVPSLLFMPWAVWLIKHAKAVSFLVSWIRPPTFEGLGNTFTQIAGGQLPLLILSILALLSLFNITKAARNERWVQLGHQQLILFAWLTAPFLVGLFLSLTVQPILIWRYLICSLPALMLLAARGLTNIARGPFVRIGLVTLISACFLPAAYHACAVAERDDNRSATAFFLEHALPSDLVVFHSRANARSYKYYARNFKFNEVSYHRIIRSRLDLPGADRIWLLSWLIPDSDVEAFRGALSTSYRSVLEQRYTNGWIPLSLVLFKRRAIDAR